MSSIDIQELISGVVIIIGALAFSAAIDAAMLPDPPEAK